MKLLSIILFVALVRGAMAEATDNLEGNQLLIASITPVARDNHISLYSDCGSPGVELYGMSPEFRRLAMVLTNSWEQSLANESAIAPDSLSRVILLNALLFLPPDEYLKRLNRVLDLYLDGKIPRDEFLYLFWFPPRYENGWFLSFNYANPKVVAFLKRVRIAFKEDKGIVSSADFILSGRAKSRDKW